MTLQESDVLQIPLVDRADATTIRVYTLVVDEVRRAGDEPLYCCRDQHGPVICLRASRLTWLRRLGTDATAALHRLPPRRAPATVAGTSPSSPRHDARTARCGSGST